MEDQEKKIPDVAPKVQDKTIKCRDCGKDFQFSAKEQEYYVKRGLKNEPVRCRDCRDVRKKGRIPFRRYNSKSSGYQKLETGEPQEVSGTTKQMGEERVGPHIYSIVGLILVIVWLGAVIGIPVVLRLLDGRELTLSADRYGWALIGMLFYLIVELAGLKNAIREVRSYIVEKE